MVIFIIKSSRIENDGCQLIYKEKKLMQLKVARKIVQNTRLEFHRQTKGKIERK
jgi:hypothetical protein